MKLSLRLVLLITAIPLIAAVLVWLSPLAFVPVPWPDDSAFYFVAKELFRWPPRWVMLPQAPFEPTYRIFNFNTMPLYPVLIGLGRFVGIDGSHALKFWPLAAWALSGSLLVGVLLRVGLSTVAALILALGFALDPSLRWASVLVRPESLVGLCGMALVLGLSLGFPKRFRPRGLWDPVAFLLVVAAYSHFNAVHLLFPVVCAFAFHPRRLAMIGGKCLLYLSPWIAMVFAHWAIFQQQMRLQWERLAVGNDWLSSPRHALESLFQSMGSPEPWPRGLIEWAGTFLWILILTALASVAVLAFIRARTFRKAEPEPAILALFPSAAWVLGALWLWHSKPEVWFTYFIHESLWCFMGLAALLAWRSARDLFRLAFLALQGASLFLVVLFGYADLSQATTMAQNPSWRWETYASYVDCIDARLSQDQAQSNRKPYRVWAPTFPDITIELSRRHPDWELTRTNDFWSRADLAVQHGRDVDAVVVNEIASVDREVSEPAAQHPELRSSWMEWQGYFLNRLWTEPGWKPRRYVCQRGRWESFIFLR